MQVQTQPLELPLASPFRIARGVQSVARNVLVQVTAGDITGSGEAAPNAFYGERQETVLAALPYLIERLGDDPLLLEDSASAFDLVFHHGNAAAKAALDMALYDLAGQRLGVPVYRLLGLDAARAPLTSYTIAIDTPAEMARRAQEAHEYPILKIKVGTSQDVAAVRAIREVTSAKLRVDANAAWTAREALRTLELLAPYDIEFVEQPVAAGDLDGLRMVHEHAPMPVIADESCVTLEDIPRVVGRVSGINIKLMKCGGVRNALAMISAARAHHLRVMLGCMIESSLAITAAAHLSPLVDYADLDGALLLAADPYEGVRVEHGRLILPDAPGLGVRARPA